MNTKHTHHQPVAHHPLELEQLLELPRDHERPLIGQFLLDEQAISTDELRNALYIARVEDGKKLGEILVELGAISQADLDTALMAQLEVPLVNLSAFNVDPQTLVLIPDDVARRYQVIPLMLHNDALVVASGKLINSEIVEILRFITQKTIINVIANTREIIQAINENYLQHDESEDLSQFEHAVEAQEQNAQDTQELKDAEFMAKQQPIVKLVDAILRTAIQRNASDIHIRPEGKHFDLLYRIDGSMIKIREYPKSVLPAVVGRIKILSRLNIAERRLPQDGRIAFRQDLNKIDLRISIIPVQYGESIVIRILNKNQGLRTISQIGFEPTDEARFQDLLSRSHGIILVTGPTGSGKTTTLYAALQEIVKQNLNIVTVEDPIEYDLPTTRQIQLIPTINFSFPQALRHILRHDPDVIMIGEMRDKETCKIAVESALTGHLVFSTLHTNDAVSSIIRLMEIGVETYMIRSAVIGILAQRLVRKNCPHCLEQEHISTLMRKNLKLKADEIFYQGKGCDQCHGTGFAGRLAVYELLLISEEIRDLIQPGMSSDQVSKIAIENGMTPLAVNGVTQARLKLTSIAEVYRACM